MDKANKEIINLRKQINKMKDILKNYVYPEIANELLREANLIKGGEEIINTSSYPIIEDDDSVTDFIVKNQEKYSDNNVIQGLFNKI